MRKSGHVGDRVKAPGRFGEACMLATQSARCIGPTHDAHSSSGCDHEVLRNARAMTSVCVLDGGAGSYILTGVQHVAVRFTNSNSMEGIRDVY